MPISNMHFQKIPRQKPFFFKYRDKKIILIFLRTTGALRHGAKLGFDLFKPQGEALDFVTNGSRFACRSTTLTRVILGYAALGNMALLLIAASVRITKRCTREREREQRRGGTMEGEDN